MFQWLQKLADKGKAGDVMSPASLKRARLMIYLIAGGVCCVCLFFLLSRNSSQVVQQANEQANPVASADEVVDARELWVNRVQNEASKTREEIEEVRRENHLLRQKVDVMDEMFSKYGSDAFQALPNMEAAPQEAPVKSSSAVLDNQLPSYGSHMQGVDYVNKAPQPPAHSFGPKILHLTLPMQEVQNRKTVDAYIPAGTYARAVLTSGVVASTSSTAQGDPQPIFIRLVDHGNIPRGFRGDLKDAVLIGACYGDLSSERAYCRLHKMSLTEKNGEVVEKQVEGWLVGEDGRPGLKGIVVDRAGEVARGALVSGILSGMAGFFKQQTTSSVFPVSPFGQTNSLSTQEVLKGSAANGVGSALDKLADFTIRRAEALQPVILVNSGREVEVVFKEGIDMSDSGVKQHLLLVGQNQREDRARQEALNHSLEMH